MFKEHTTEEFTVNNDGTLNVKKKLDSASI